MKEVLLQVFAAASLAGAFGDIGRDFEAAHPGTRVRFNFAGSQQLALQIEQGAGADVFASADARWMEYVGEKGRLGSSPEIFARNRLVAIVPRTNPARIARLQDFSLRGVRLVIGADAVPVGRYSREMLAKLGAQPGFPSDFANRVLTNVVSEEENVRSVVGKVQLGEADAGICYRSDVTKAVSRFVRVFEIPDSAQVVASYPIATMSGSRTPDLAKAFLAHVLSAEGQRALERHDLIPAAPRAP